MSNKIFSFQSLKDGVAKIFNATKVGNTTVVQDISGTGGGAIITDMSSSDVSNTIGVQSFDNMDMQVFDVVDTGSSTLVQNISNSAPQNTSLLTDLDNGFAVNNLTNDTNLFNTSQSGDTTLFQNVSGNNDSFLFRDLSLDSTSDMTNDIGIFTAVKSTVNNQQDNPFEFSNTWDKKETTNTNPFDFDPFKSDKGKK